MKKLAKEFKEFISKGNVLDMAIGVIIATAFGKITATLINSILMPFIAWIFGAQNMSALNVVVRPAELDAAGEVVREAITLGFGDFVGAVIDFVLIALIVFAIVKGANAMRKKKEEAPKPKEPSNEEKLLTEIRDLLKQK